MSQPWQYTTFLDLIDHWQALIAGLLGFAAAVVAVVLTLRIERSKLQREMDALQKSLAVELRQLVPNALIAAASLGKLAREQHPITARMVESLARVPGPVVYPTNADKIGLLGSDAMDVVIVYSLIELGRSSTASLISSRTPDDTRQISIVLQLVMAIPFVVLMLAAHFLAGSNLLILFTDKPGTVRPHSDRLP